MSEHATRRDTQNWDLMTCDQVLKVLVYELYNPVSLLGNHLNRLVGDEDPLTEDEYEAIFEQMQTAVRQLSKTVVHLRRYVQENEPPNPPK